MKQANPIAAAGMAPSETNRPLERRIAMRAAEWFVLLDSGEAGTTEKADFQRWHDSDPEHARAWARIQHVSRRAGSVPAAIGSPILRRAATLDRRVAIKALVLLITAPPAAMLAWNMWPQQGQRYATATGEQREVTLPDGTRLRLNTASEISLAYSMHERVVVLHTGEILIETASDPMQTQGAGRPFLVRTAEGQVRAIGTRFVVRQLDAMSTVSVLQGAVELMPMHDSAPHRLEAGQQGSFDEHSVGAVEAVDAMHGGAWAQGILAVHDMRLDEFVAELSRYRRGHIRCDAAVAHLRLTGAFQLADTDRILQNLIELLPVEVTFYTRYWTSISARNAD